MANPKNLEMLRRSLNESAHAAGRDTDVEALRLHVGAITTVLNVLLAEMIEEQQD